MAWDGMLDRITFGCVMALLILAWLLVARVFTHEPEPPLPAPDYGAAMAEIEDTGMLIAPLSLLCVEVGGGPPVPRRCFLSSMSDAFPWPETYELELPCPRTLRVHAGMVVCGDAL